MSSRRKVARRQQGKGQARPNFAPPQRVSKYDPGPSEIVDLEPTLEEKQAEVVRRLRSPGQQRARLARELELADQKVRPLVLEAVRLGVPYRRVSELAGVSRATVARWAKGALQVTS